MRVAALFACLVLASSCAHGRGKLVAEVAGACSSGLAICAADEECACVGDADGDEGEQ